MSDSDAQISVVSAAPAEGNAATPLIVTAPDDIASFAEDWPNWASAGSDAQAVDQGMDLVSSDSGEWFPGVAAGSEAAMALAIPADADPLISLPSADLANLGQDAATYDNAVAFAHSAVDAANMWETLSAPLGYGMPLDHIEWHFAGLLPLV